MNNLWLACTALIPFLVFFPFLSLSSSTFSSNTRAVSIPNSATGGADSRPVSEKGSPTEDQAGMVGNGNKLEAERDLKTKRRTITLVCFVVLVTNKVTAGAKSFGSFFSGALNKAGAKIQETVKSNVSLSPRPCDECNHWLRLNCSLFSASSTKSRRRSSRTSRARVAMSACAHGSAIRTRIKSKRRSSVCRA